MPDLQSQKAGDGSTQIQVHGDMILGVTEERAKEIALEQARFVVAEYSAEAQGEIRVRLDELDARIIPSLSSMEMLDSFSNPAFQRTYRKAQNGAAASERPLDYDMLSALLRERALKPRDRPITAGIDRAVEIVDQLDETALRAITVLMAISTWHPASGLIMHGLDSLDKMMSQFLDGPLPEGDEWLDHLDLLDAVRVDATKHLKSFGDYYAARMPGYVAAGIEESKAPQYVGGDFPLHPWGPFLVDHELKPGYVRLNSVGEGVFRHNLTDAPTGYVDAMITAAAVEFGFGQIDESIKPAFIQAVNERPALSAAGAWWDAIGKDGAPRLTSVGRAIAVANMYRLDDRKLLPEKNQAVS